jgi:hypothetical protein
MIRMDGTLLAGYRQAGQRASYGSVEHGQCAAIPFTPDQAFCAGRLEFAMFAKDAPLRVKIQQGAIERSTAEF